MKNVLLLICYYVVFACANSRRQPLYRIKQKKNLISCVFSVYIGKTGRVLQAIGWRDLKRRATGILKRGARKWLNRTRKMVKFDRATLELNSLKLIIEPKCFPKDLFIFDSTLRLFNKNTIVSLSRVAWETTRKMRLSIIIE